MHEFPYVLIDTLYNTRHAEHGILCVASFMSEEEIERKIAVIFATDVVGYSKHMEADESSTIKNLKEDIKRYEPRLALDGGNDGLDLIKKVIYKAKYILKVKGMLALEIGNEQFKKVSKILLKNNFRIEHTIKDYKDNIRCIITTYKGK